MSRGWRASVTSRRSRPTTPPRLRGLNDGRAPASITVRGGRVEATCAVAVVGSRSALDAAAAFTRDLAAAIARAGGAVVSGGALGIDAAAHRGALECGGTYLGRRPGTGHEHCFPAAHADLFERIGDGPGAMLWPFAPHFQHRMGFVQRNRVSLLRFPTRWSWCRRASSPGPSTRRRARSASASRYGWCRPLPGCTSRRAAPLHGGFAGSLQLLAAGARPLTSVPAFLAAMGLDDHSSDEAAIPPPIPAVDAPGLRMPPA